MLPDDESIISFHTESMLLGNFAHLKKMSQENVSCNEKGFFFYVYLKLHYRYHVENNLQNGLKKIKLPG